MRKCIRRFILMFQFFTTIPLPFELKVNEEDFGKGLVFAPVVGLIIGAVLMAFQLLFEKSNLVLLPAVLIMILYIILTGGIHFDGLGDTFDGLFSNKPREKMLEIMRDSRLGTNALLAVVSVFMTDVAVIANIHQVRISSILLLMPAAGRVGTLTAAAFSRYARKEEGLGKAFVDYCGKAQWFIGLILIIPAFYLALNIEGLFLLLLSIACALAFTLLFTSKIGGMTGDTLGAVCELNQAFFITAALFLT